MCNSSSNPATCALHSSYKHGRVLEGALQGRHSGGDDAGLSCQGADPARAAGDPLHSALLGWIQSAGTGIWHRVSCL